MTVTNTSEDGRGIWMSNAKVELFDVALKECESTALRIHFPDSATTLVATRCVFANSNNGVLVSGSLSSATFNNCVFNDNENDGISEANGATIHLHGEATAIHSNGRIGIYALYSGKIIIHLPSHHNTSYNNGEDDRKTTGNDTATITNVED